ncbi:helix-turn-helix domain-containing protein [Acinetobacter gerneri]|uniref:AraC family transcriptional regulator n=1 Tax=Acinetobacter gerneri TaxID=202952 RepID=UPI00293593A0|nr:helix-turn-helix domain-containing protein [Acinetobacter gerneri]MDV2440082.1 helix-turn-helix domain-containing protein [Acinetobacter gerneri]
MQTILKNKSVGSGMIRLLNKFCNIKKIKTPVKNKYDVNDNIYYDLWLNKIKCVQQQYNKEGLGLEIAKYVDIRDIGICAYIAESCESLLDYLPIFEKYSKIWYNYTKKNIFFNGDEVIISWNKGTYYTAGLYIRETIISEELQVAIIFQRISQMLGIFDNIFTKLELSIPTPKDPSIYENYFKCPVFFDMHQTSIFISTKILSTKKEKSDTTLFYILIQYAEVLLKNIPKESDFVKLVKLSIVKSILNGNPHIDNIAKYLNISTRSLQNILKTQNASFQDLLKESRVFLAKKYLKETDLSIIEIANLLGYKEQTSFTRAFKIWTGETPTCWRNNHIKSSLYSECNALQDN